MCNMKTALWKMLEANSIIVLNALGRSETHLILIRFVLLLALLLLIHYNKEQCFFLLTCSILRTSHWNVISLLYKCSIYVLLLPIAK